MVIVNVTYSDSCNVQYCKNYRAISISAQISIIIAISLIKYAPVD